jgi:metal-dependent HD superfamily phosphatase/phosphodiesterase
LATSSTTSSDSSRLPNEPPAPGVPPDQQQTLDTHVLRESPPTRSAETADGPKTAHPVPRTPAASPDGAERHLVTFDSLRRDPEVEAFIRRADAQLGVLGYTEHGQRHTSLVGQIGRNVLQRLGYPERTCELAAVAGYLHDIGNCVNRRDHATVGAVMAKDLLVARGMTVEEVTIVMGAIGNHEESTGEPVGEISAAVNIADKSDVHRSRVRETDPMKFDIHDRVNYASQHSFVRVDGETKRVELEMTIDTSIAPLMDYFEIFLNRMVFIRRAVQFLGCEFRLTINRNRIL